VESRFRSTPTSKSCPKSPVPSITLTFSRDPRVSGHKCPSDIRSAAQIHCSGAMGIAGGLWRVETRVKPSVSFSIPARRRAVWPDGNLGSSNRPFSMKAPRADVSEPGGPGLPGPGGLETAGEPARANRHRISALLFPARIEAPKWPSHWSVRDNTCGNSHCAPTPCGNSAADSAGLESDPHWLARQRSAHGLGDVRARPRPSRALPSVSASCPLFNCRV
jgi:hypothetical protein